MRINHDRLTILPVPAQDAVLTKEVRLLSGAYRNELLAATLGTPRRADRFFVIAAFFLKTDPLPARPELVELIGVCLVNGDLGDLAVVNLEVDRDDDVQCPAVPGCRLAL